MEPLEAEVIKRICACSALRSAARSITQLYDLVLQPSGLKATQFITLKTVAQAGEIAQWRYASENAIAVETVSRRLGALRKRGLLSTRTCGKNRERVFTLTDQGRRALREALPYWQRAQERFRHTLKEDNFHLLLQSCRRAVEASRKAEQLRFSNFPRQKSTTSER
jgi:DNA-binding MarR family transcriptional regulator